MTFLFLTFCFLNHICRPLNWMEKSSFILCYALYPFSLINSTLILVRHSPQLMNLGSFFEKKENEVACEPVFSPSPLETNYYICSTIARGTEPSRRLGKAIRQHALSAQHPASQDAALSFADYPRIQRVATGHELLEELQVQFGVASAGCSFI